MHSLRFYCIIKRKSNNHKSLWVILKISHFEPFATHAQFNYTYVAETKCRIFSIQVGKSVTTRPHCLRCRPAQFV